MVYLAIDVARYIVSKCFEEDCPISNLQLQKILYYIQKDYLQSGKVAFSDNIQAWPFGPVVSSVYDEYCGFGAMPITLTYENINICLEDKKCFDPIINEKRKLDPWDMVDETHKSGGAWEQIYNCGAGKYDVIPNSLIISKG